MSNVFTECSSTSLPLVITPSSGTFKSIGKVSCDNDGILFYANGTQSFINLTQCNSSAKWEGLDNAECWNGNEIIIIIAQFK